MEHLAQQVAAFSHWKQDLNQSLQQLRGWLKENQLLTEDLSERLTRYHQLLEQKSLTIAFVGEFSRGKTELINALFFSGYQTRILPSKPGRTTMCPTEFFYDTGAPYPYIRLLPIDSRQSDSTIADFSRIPQHWKELRLDPEDPNALQESFLEVARTRAVPPQKAEQLGFDTSTLETSPSDPQLVIIPAWRHALVNFRHPLLQSGLRILDTPGLNALGSEPELTLSMLPKAQAVIFLLSADCGVTASDMGIWQGHLQHLENRRYAVLNKIDSLWDDIQGEQSTEQMIAQLRQHTAQQLALKPEQIIPLSAKHALLAKIRQDSQQLQRSGLQALEQLLGEELIGHQETLLEEQVVRDLNQVLTHSAQQLQNQLHQLERQQKELANNPIDNQSLAASLQRLTETELLRYQKQLISLRPSRRLIEQQSKILLRATRQDDFKQLIDQTRNELEASLTTRGMGGVISQFFRALYRNLHSLEIEYRLAQRMVNSIYKRLTKELPNYQALAPEFSLEATQKQLRALHHRADRFHLQINSLLTPKPLLIRRFFSTLVHEVEAWHQSLQQQAARFAEDALLPLMHGLLQHKELLQQQLEHLQRMQQHQLNDEERAEQLTELIGAQRVRLQQVEQLQKSIRRPSPILSTRKVVRLPGTHDAA